MNKNILKKINKTLKIAKNSNLYKEKLKKHNCNIKDTISFRDLPFTTKEDLRNASPYGALATTMDKVVEMHTTSGTTGKVTLSFYTKEDLLSGSRAISRAWKELGITSKSKVQFMMSYGLFSGATINTYAIQYLGGFVLPAGIQSYERQIDLIKDFKVDTLVGTPSYYYHLYDRLHEEGLSLGGLGVKTGIAAGEIYSDSTRKDLEDKLKIKIFDHYGICEVNTGIAYECKYKNGLHMLDDYVYTEIIDPVTGENVPDGEDGELVLTSLEKEASPVIRYRTGDITSIIKGKCKCGRKSLRISRIKRRLDDLMFVKGIKIDPHELKDFVVFTFGKYIYSDIKIMIKNRDRVSASIKVCLKNNKNTGFLKKIQKKIKDETMVNFKIINVKKDFFDRGSNNKVRFFDYVN